MTANTRAQRIADAALWCAVAINGASMGLSLARGAYAIAGLSAVVVPTLLGWQIARHKWMAILETKYATARTELEKAETELQMVKRMSARLDHAMANGYFTVHAHADDYGKPQ